MIPCRRLAGVLLVAAMIGTGVSACSGAGGEVVTVDHTVGHVRIGAGDTLVVHFGGTNPSIGDEWELTSPPDESVLRQGEVVVTELDPGTDGGYLDLDYTFEGLASGSTTLGFTYSYRGTVGDPGGRTKDDAPTITVTVED